VQFASDYDRLSHIPGYLAIRKFSTPPRLSNLEGFGFSSDDVKGLKDCKPQNCVVQLPAAAMETLQRKQLDTFKRAFSTCMDARGYSVQ